MEKINLNMGVMYWWEQASEKYGTDVVPEFRETVKHTLLAMTFMQTDASMRGLCATSLGDFVGDDWGQLCFLLYLLGKYGLRIEMSKEELDAYKCAYESECGRESLIVEDEPEYGKRKKPDKPDATDWAQLWWELAKNLWAVDYNTSTYAMCLKQVDELIKEYKKSLKTEE